jgi:hypothetical protein
MNASGLAALQLIGTMLFGVGWLVALASWIYAVFEFQRYRQRDPRVFDRGPVVLSFSDPTLTRAEIGELRAEIDTASGKLVPLAPDRFGFIPRFGSLLRPMSGPGNLLPFAGVVSWEDGCAKVTVRAPLGIAAFVATCVVMWLAYATFLGSATVCRLSGHLYTPGSAECVSVGLIPPLIVVALAAIGAWAIRGRARSFFAEAKNRVLEFANVAK